MFYKYLILLACLGRIGGFCNAHSAGAPQLAELVSTQKVHRISSYPTSLRCIYSDLVDGEQNVYGAAAHLKQRPLTIGTMKFEIWAQQEQSGAEVKVGDILTEWYPASTPYMLGGQIPLSQVGKILRLRHIEVGKDTLWRAPDPLQQQGHGTRALETLFAVWRRECNFPEGTEVWLECQVFKPYLKPWYEKFGFVSTFTPKSLLEEHVEYMKADLNKTKFPLQRKLKEAKKTAAQDREAATAAS